VYTLPKFVIVRSFVDVGIRAEREFSLENKFFVYNQCKISCVDECTNDNEQ